MKLKLTLLSLLLIAFVGCESEPRKVIKKKKPSKQDEEEQPEYIDHTGKGGGPYGNGSKFAQANGKVPLTQNPGTPAGNVPKAANPTPAPDPNVPTNISKVWNGKEFFSNTNVEVKPLGAQQ